MCQFADMLLASTRFLPCWPAIDMLSSALSIYPTVLTLKTRDDLRVLSVFQLPACPTSPRESRVRHARQASELCAAHSRSVVHLKNRCKSLKSAILHNVFFASHGLLCYAIFELLVYHTFWSFESLWGEVVVPLPACHQSMFGTSAASVTPYPRARYSTKLR
jgi:hypothetical protein